MLTATLPMTPGEIVLGNRIRSCFPARIRDLMLPAADDDLVQRVRNATNTHTLSQRDARLWVVHQLHAHQLEWDVTESELCRKRVAALFAGEVLR